MKMIILSEEDFVKVSETMDIPPSHMIEIQVDGEKICLVNVEGKFYAIGSICTHEGGPLADGTLEGYEIECPWHGSKFDVRTGEVKNPPASEPEPSYEVKVDGTNLLIKKQGKSKPPQIELTLMEKDKVNGTDVVSFKFSKDNDDQINNKTLNYNAGQFAFFDIGQVYNDPKGPIRHFTISSSPTENFIMLTTRIRDSPYRSMIKYATDMQLPLPIIMFDSNRDRNNILFKKEFDDWASINKNLKIIYTISEKEEEEEEQQQHNEQSPLSTANDWKGEYGRIDKAMILKYVDTNVLNDSIFYICGPPNMLKAMQTLLQEDLEIPKERIKVEEFTGY